MPAANYDILIEQGASFSFSGKIQDEAGVGIDLTGAAMAAVVRRDTSDPNILATFVCTLANQLTNKGEFTVSLNATGTAAIETLQSGGAVRTITYGSWDLLVTYPSGTKVRYLQGVARISPRVTA